VSVRKEQPGWFGALGKDSPSTLIGYHEVNDVAETDAVLAADDLIARRHPRYANSLAG